MTNKEYKPLTTGGYANPKMLPQYRDRLCYLEDCIENGKLVFLPCNIGDKFWWIYTSPIGEKKVQQEEVYSISIMKDGRFLLRTFDCCSWELHEVYFSKEAAEKALEEMKKC